jgi:hypothetical protein
MEVRCFPPRKGHPPDRRWGGHQAHFNTVVKGPSARKRYFIPRLMSPHPNRYSDQSGSAPPQVRVPSRSWFSCLTESCRISGRRVHTEIAASVCLASWTPSAKSQVLQIAALARDVTAERAPTFKRWVTTFQAGSSVKVFPAITRYASQPVQSRSQSLLICAPIYAPTFQASTSVCRATTWRTPSHLTLVLRQIPRIQTVL